MLPPSFLTLVLATSRALILSAGATGLWRSAPECVRRTAVPNSAPPLLLLSPYSLPVSLGLPLAKKIKVSEPLLCLWIRISL